MPKIKATANVICTAGKFWCQYRKWKSFFNIIYWSSEKTVKLQIFPCHHSWQILFCLSEKMQDGHLLATRTVSLANGKAYKYQKGLLWVATGTSHYEIKEKIKIQTKTKCFQTDFFIFPSLPWKAASYQEGMETATLSIKQKLPPCCK